MIESQAGAVHRDRRHALRVGVADGLCLAAAPTFAVMAVVSAVAEAGRAQAFCAPAQNAWPVDAMVLMYLLMSAFHLAPWLRLIGSRRAQGARASGDIQATGTGQLSRT